MDCGATRANTFIAAIDFSERNMPMPKKPPSLLQLFLHLVLKPIVGQTSAPSNPLVELPQHPLPTDREAWRVHWQAQGQPWRTEPEIDEKRQECLATRRTISPDIKQGIYPFKDIKLNRADVEWLLATNPGGPVYPHNKSQRKYEGLDLRGANLCGVDLRKLPITFMRGGLNWDEWLSATHEQREMAGIHLERADLSRTHLEEAYLNHAYLGHTSFLWTS